MTTNSSVRKISNFDPPGIERKDNTDGTQAYEQSTTSTALSKELASAWLAWQCTMVAGIVRGAVYRPNDIKLKSALSIWPDKGECEPQMVAASVQAQKKSGSVKFSKIAYGTERQRICDVVACTIMQDGEVIAIVSVAISVRSEPQQHAVIQLLRWGGLWIETLSQEHQYKQKNGDAFPLKLMSAILSQPTAHGCAVETVNQLADNFKCERVSIGFRQKLLIRLQALSHVTHFDSRTQFVRKIEAAMEESADQHKAIIQHVASTQTPSTPPTPSNLAELPSGISVVSIPFTGASGVFGAITLESVNNRPFNNSSVKTFESIAQLISPILEIKLRDERSLRSHMIESMLDKVGSIFGTAFLKIKIILAAVFLLLVTLSMISGSHEVTAPSIIEGAVRQILVAPQDGYIKQTLVRAGDDVVKGQDIALLDDQNLQLELQKWLGEKNQYEKKFQSALARSERTQLGILKAQLAQVDAEIQKVNEAIERLHIKAPFDGVIVSGDLSQSLGSPVRTGQLLYEVAPLEQYRVVLEVNEFDIGALELDKPGSLIVAAFPDSPLALSIDQVVPLAVNSSSGNFFRVEASLEKPSALLRPGMRGVARVAAGEHKLIWILTHALIDRIRLWTWSVGL